MTKQMQAESHTERGFCLSKMEPGSYHLSSHVLSGVEPLGERQRELLSRQVTRIECRVPLLTVPCSDTSSYGELIIRASEQWMETGVNGKKREFEGERKPGIKV